MASTLKRYIPQVGNPSKEVNPTIGSDRVKASVVGAGAYSGDAKMYCQTDMEDLGGALLDVRESEVETGPQTPLSNARLVGAGAGKPGSEVAKDISTSVGVAEEENKALNLLQEELKGLVNFVLGKNNIHKELKEMARASERALVQYLKAKSVRDRDRAGSATASMCRACQISPIFRPGPTNRGMRGRSPPLTRAQVPAKKARKEVQNRASATAPSSPEQMTRALTTEWSTVVKKGKKKNKKKQSQKSYGGVAVSETKSRPDVDKPEPRTMPRALRPDAIKIKALASVSYADLLRKVKAAPELKPLAERVTKIRRTRAEELLLELGQAGIETPALQKVVSSTLQESATVQVLTHKEAPIIRDVDESTTESEVAEAINAAVGQCDLPPESIKLRGAYGGTQLATVLLPAGAAKKLLKNGKLRVGWVNCRVKLREPSTRCYRCHEDEHTARECNSEVDRSKQCFRCGQEEHKVVACTASKRDAAMELVREEGAVIISEEYRDLETPNWAREASGRAAIWICGNLHMSGRMSTPQPGFTWVEVPGMRIYICYLPPRRSDRENQDEYAGSLDAIVASARSSRLPVDYSRRNTRGKGPGTYESPNKGLRCFYERTGQFLRPPTWNEDRWWNEDIAQIRRECLQARRLHQRARNGPRYKDLTAAYKNKRKELKTAIKKAKRRGQVPPSCPLLLDRIVRHLFPEHEQRTVGTGLRLMAEDDAEEPPEVSESKLRMAASRISIQKASEPDGIPGLAIKTAALNASALFQSTFSACLAEGCFLSQWKAQSYLHRIKVMSSPECPTCPGADEDVGHVLFQCPRFVKERSCFQALWKGPQTPEGIGTWLLSSRERWDGMVTLATSIIDRLGLIRREIERGGSQALQPPIN
ncbi:hypothetical protein KM043_015682 [Ampulex compressa]|nr:hypothetical protein KM043_015682 [Ampulex compressa]